jgi:hypothetical protein
MKTGTWSIAGSLALACAIGCHKKEQEGAIAEIAVADAVDASGAEAGAVAGGDVVPPVPPLVPADPNIPLHEAVVGAAPIPADNAAPVAPPAPVVEEQPPQPDAQEAWIPGYWWWSPPLARYVWVSGAWRHAPPDQVWTPGAWTPADGHFVWTPGFWGPQGYARVTIDAAPPPLQLEVPGNAPGVGFVWTPGYYGYRDGGYVWMAGAWGRPPMGGVGWIAPRYVGIGPRYYLQPGRWDFPPERRGVAYRPEIDVRAGERLHLTPVGRGVLVAHANYVSACSHAIAMGAKRTPGGGFAMPHAGENRPGERRPEAEGHEGESHAGFDSKAKMEPPHENHEIRENHENRENHGPEGAPQHAPGQGPQHGPPVEHAHAAPPVEHSSGGKRR